MKNDPKIKSTSKVRIEKNIENESSSTTLLGSRSGQDTSTALLQLYDKWVQEMEEDKIVGVLVCDQSADFDLCDHSILLKKLGLMGLQEKSLNWVNSRAQ